MTDNISPFVFKKLSLAHLGIDKKEIILKFRRATFVDNEYFREKYGGKDTVTTVFEDPIIVVKSMFRFLTRGSIDEIKGLNIIKRCDETGDLLPKDKQYTMMEKFLMLFVSNKDNNSEVFRLFLSILGYDEKQIDILTGLAEPDKKPKEKKRQETTLQTKS